MTIEFTCLQSNCGRKLRGPDELAGKQVKCPGCGTLIRVPPPAQPETPAQAVSQARVVSKPAPPADPLVGTTLGHFEISQKLGQGGMGAVYKARNTSLNRTVALKLLPESVKQRDPSFTERFTREAQLAAQLEHFNVVAIYSVAELSGHHFIEMQYVEGRTLRQMIDSGALDVNEVTRIIHEAAKGLAAAQKKGIMHRDVKPENIMIDKDGQVKVADFGLAKLEQSSTGLTLSGQIMGTPLYMSPEQAKGVAVDSRSDIYSLGATFFHAMTGRTPFISDSIHGLIYQHIHEPSPSANMLNPNCPAETSAVIHRMMAKDPAQRYQTYDELLADLNAILSRGQLSESTLQKAAELKRDIRGGKKKSKGGLLAAVAVIVLLIAGAVGIAIMKSRGGTPLPPEERRGGSPQPPDVGKAATDEHGSTRIAQKKEPEVRIQKPEGKAETVIARGETPKQSHKAAIAEPTKPKPEPTAEPKPEEPSRKGAETAEKKDEEDTTKDTKSTTPSSQSQIDNRKSTIDLVAFLDDTKAINECIESGDYAGARGRANLLKTKYPDLIETKLANIERILALRKRCFDRINAGAVKLSMGDISRKYAFAGEIKKADEHGLTGKIPKKWDSFSREEITEFHRKASDPRSAEDRIGLAAFLMEGAVDEKRLDAALGPLGDAAGLGADVSSLEKYVETLKQGRKQYAEAEAKGKSLETAEATTKDTKPTKEETEIQNQQSKIQNDFDDVYVTDAATGDKIPHPLSRKTYTLRVGGKKIEVPEGMVYVPEGEFVMGEGASEHKVWLDAFCIGKYEVTNAEWKVFVDATGFSAIPSHWKGRMIPERKESHPVLLVSWEDAKAYCDWSSKRLPTEAEWEKAASWNPKRKVKLKYPWGNEWDSKLCNSGWMLSKSGFRPTVDPAQWAKMWQQFEKSETGKKVFESGGNTTPVGSFKSVMSPYGCYDTAGNVYEACSDWYKEDYYALPDTKRNPQGPREDEATDIVIGGTGKKARVLRGGAWYGNEQHCAATARNRDHPTRRTTLYSGFRCALSAADLEKWKASKPEAKKQELGDRSQETEGEKQKTEVMSQKSEARDEKSSVDSVSSVVRKTIVVRQDGKGDFKTIQEAIDAAHDGDTIHIADTAIYTQPTIDGTKKKGITLRGTITKKGMTTLQWERGNSPEPTTDATAVNLLVIGPDWTIDHIRFENTRGRTYLVQATWSNSVGNAALRDCWFRGIRMNRWCGIAQGMLEHCVFDDCGMAAQVATRDPESQLTFRNNVLYRCDWALKHYQTRFDPKVAVSSNIFAGIRSTVFWVLITEPGEKPKPFDMQADSNCFFRIACYQRSNQIEATGLPTTTTFKEWQNLTKQDRHSIEADPMFVNPEKGDFRLQPKSPCRGRGPKKDGKKTDIGVDWDEFFGKE